MEQRGSITVLLSSVFLCLILIVLTLIDSTLIYMGRVQANRAVSSASYSLLSEYNRPLMEVYGLFGVDKHLANDHKAKDYVLGSLNPYRHIERKEEWQLYHYDILDTSVVHNDMLIEQEVLEAQILEHMKYRGPLSAIEPFIMKVEAIEKVAATGHLMKEKVEEVDKPVVNLNQEYEKLIRYVEGFEPKNKVEKYFIKMLVVSSEYYATGIPDDDLTYQLKANLLMLDEVKTYINSLPIILEDVYTIKRYEDEIKKIEEEISQLEKEMNDVEKDSTDESETSCEESSDAVDRLKKKIEEYGTEIQAMEEELIDQYGHEGINDYEDLLSYLEGVHVSYRTTFDEILYLTEKSIKVIHNIKDESSRIKEGILTICEDIDRNQDEYDIKTIESIEEGLKEVEEKIYDPNSDTNMSDKSSIKRMLQILERNQVCLAQLCNEMKKLEGLSNYLLEAMEPAIYLDDFTEMNQAYKDFDALEMACDKVNLNYSSDVQFEFGEFMANTENPSHNMNKQLNESKDFEFIESRKGDLLTVGDEVYNELPSIIIQDIVEHRGNFQLTVDEEGSFNESFFDQLTRFDLGEVTEELLYEIYVNEYLLEVFNDAVECKNRGEDSEYMEYQVEYVIGGQFNDFQNAKIVETEILLMRSAMNFLHILNCSEKKTAVKFLANSIAGWWSAGIGTIIVQGVLMGIWALAESFVDMSKLTQGEEVAFYKLESDWVLSLDGMISFGIDKLSEETIELVTDTIDEMGDKISETGSDMMDELGQLTEDNVEAFLEDSAYRITEVVKTGVDQIDEEVNRVIQGTTEAIITGKEIPSYPHLNNGLVRSLQEAVLNKEDTIKTYGYDAIDQVSEYAVHESIELINGYQEKLVESGKEALTNATNQLQEDIKNQASKAIEETMKNLEGELTTYVNAIPVGGASAKKPSKFPSIGFAYIDYLRLLLLIQPDATKMSRVADLIQLDMIENYNPHFRIMNYATTVQVESTITKSLIFSQFLNLQVSEKNKIGNKVKYEAISKSTY